MRAEARWLRNAPSDLQIYCGRMIETGVLDGRGFYLTEYEYLPVLSELFALGAIGQRAWMRIMASCETFLNLCAAHKGPGSGDAALRALAVDKTLARLEDQARADAATTDSTPETQVAATRVPTCLGSSSIRLHSRLRRRDSPLGGERQHRVVRVQRLPDHPAQRCCCAV